MQFIFTFTLIYLISTIVGQNMHMFTLEPKTLCIPSPTIYTFLIFPYSLIGNKTNLLLNDQKLMLSELLFCIGNQIILVCTMVLQLIPAMPCEVIEITFGQRYGSFDITIDTYNQKIPLGAILTLVFTELLVLFGEITIRTIRNKEFRKKLGRGTVIGTFALCLLFLVGLLFSIQLLF